MGAKNHRKYIHKHPGPPFQIRGGPGSFSIAQKSNVEIVRNLASAVYDHYVGFDDGENDQETLAEDQGNLLKGIDNCVES